MRPTQLHPDAQLEHDVSEDRIPFCDLAVSLPLQGDSLRPIEHAHQRSSTPTVMMFCQVAHQALHGLVFHHTDADKSRVLQARSEEVDTTGRPVKKSNIHVPKARWAKSPGQPFDWNQRLFPFCTTQRPRTHQ